MSCGSTCTRCCEIDGPRAPDRGGRSGDRWPGHHAGPSTRSARTSKCSKACTTSDRWASASTSCPTPYASSTRWRCSTRCAAGQLNRRTSCTTRIAVQSGERHAAPPGYPGRSCRSIGACSRKCCSTRSSIGSGPTISISVTDSCGWTQTTTRAELRVRHAARRRPRRLRRRRGCSQAAATCRSAARPALPGRGPAALNGALLWRGLAEVDPVLDGRTMVWAGHRDQKSSATRLPILPTAVRCSTSSPSCVAPNRGSTACSPAASTPTTMWSPRFPAIPGRARLPPTTAIVEANRGMGPEVPMQLVHERAPHGFDDIDDVITRAEIDEVTEAYRTTAGFALSPRNDPRSLIERGSRLLALVERGSGRAACGRR